MINQNDTMTNWDTLMALASEYRIAEPSAKMGDRVRSLHVMLLSQEEGSLRVISDAVSVFTAGIAEPLIAAHVLQESALTPQMREAWDLAYPDQSLTSLGHYSPQQLVGFVNGWKGKYFEVLVRDELNQGHWVGDLHLAAGETAHLATQIMQPGWDLVITDAHGAVAQELQLKATNSLSYLKQALEHYPHIQILTTNEVLDANGHLTAHFAGSLAHSGYSNKELTDQITDGLETALADGTIWDDIADLLPALPFVLITIDEGRQVIMRGKTLAAALQSGGERMAASGAALAVGGALAVLNCGVLSAPVALLVRARVTRQFRVKHGTTKLTDAAAKLHQAVRETVSTSPA